MALVKKLVMKFVDTAGNNKSIIAKDSASIVETTETELFDNE
ncbi:hypothetical protein SH2C18_45980 [Clostridium sediminicola]